MKWDDSLADSSHRQEAELRLRSAIASSNFSQVLESNDLIGFTDASLTIEFLEAGLSHFTAEECFFLARNLIPRLLVADIENPRLHGILSRLMRHGSDGVRAQTCISVRETPVEYSSSLPFKTTLIEGIRQSLALPDGEGESARRLLYRIRRENRHDPALITLVASAIRQLDVDSGAEYESIVDAAAAVATLPPSERDWNAISQALERFPRESEDRTFCQFVKCLIDEDGSEVKLIALAEKCQRHSHFGPLLQNYSGESDVAKERVRMIVDNLFGSLTTVPSIAVGRLCRNRMLEGEGQKRQLPPNWPKRNGAYDMEIPKDWTDESVADRWIIASVSEGIDVAELGRRSATIDNVWRRCYLFGGVCAMQARFGQDAVTMLEERTADWRMKYIVLSELIHDSELRLPISQSALLECARHDKSPFYIVTLLCIQFATLRNIELKSDACESFFLHHDSVSVRARYSVSGHQNHN